MKLIQKKRKRPLKRFQIGGPFAAMTYTGQGDVVEEAKDGFAEQLDKVITRTHPVRQVIQSLIPMPFQITQTPWNFSNTYMSQIQNLAAIRIDELKKQGKLPKEGKIASFSLEPSTYRKYNAGRGSTPTYAKFDKDHFMEILTTGDNAAEYTNGGMSGRIIIDPRDPSKYLIELTDISAWDLDGGKKTKSAIRNFMGKYGTKQSDPNAVRQRFYLSLPIDYQYTPGITKYGDYQIINQDEAKRLFESYSN